VRQGRNEPNFESRDEECKHLASKTFHIIELVEVAGVKGASFDLIRKKLLNLGNDIIRMGDKSYEAGD
jgi:hypothetical protein